MSKRFFYVKMLVALLAIGFLGFVSVGKANAAVMSAESLYKLGIMRGVRTCYGVFGENRIKVSDFKDSYSIFNTEIRNAGSQFSSNGASTVYIPTHVGTNYNKDDNERDSNLSCEQVFKGYDGGKSGRLKGFSDYYNIPTTLENLGYVFIENEITKDSNGGDSGVDQVTISIGSITDATGGNAGNAVSPKGSITCSGTRNTKGKKYYWKVDSCSGTLSTIYDKEGKELIGFSVYYPGNVGNVVRASSDYAWDKNEDGEVLSDMQLYLEGKIETISNYKEKNLFSFQKAIEESDFYAWLQLYIKKGVDKKYNDSKISFVLSNSMPEADETGNAVSIYGPLEGKKWISADKMLENVGFDESLPHKSYGIQGNSVSVRQYIWDNTAKYSLYYYYLTNMMAKYPGINLNECGSSAPSNFKYVFKNKADQWCGINIPSDSSSALSEFVSIVDVSGDLRDGRFEEVLIWFSNEGVYNEIAESEYAAAPISDQGELTPGGSGVVTDASGNQCWESNIDSMAWVMCPAEANLKEFANGMGKYIDNWLQVDSDIYKNGSPAQIAWGYVRTIANTLMILFMGVIIFSQLTGFGIDNYGIKKLLPKFIVMAVLVNLSFFICQLAVDLSNIAGNGIQGLFYGIGNNIISAAGVDASKAFSEGFVEAITKAIYAISVAGPGIIGAGLTIYSAYLGGGTAMAVILVLLMLLTIIAGILMFFVSLGARMVILIACMILAPLALVCYILPNTKPAYKKWFDAFKAALIIYPICGFTVGISYIVKAIVLTQAEPPIWMVVVSGIVPYLPFFMIPTMLKGVISAIGSIGAALSTVGSTFKSGAGKMQSTLSDSIKNSDRWKNATRLTSERRTNMRAGISEKTGNLTKAGKLHAKFANSKIGQFVGEDRLQAARIAAAKKNLETGQEAQAALTGAVADVEISKNKTNAAGFNAGTREAFYAKQYLEAARSSNINDMNAAILAMNKSGMKKKDIAKVIRYAENNGYLNGLNSDTRSAFYRSMVTNRDNAGFLATDFELSQFATKSGNGTLGDYGSYAKNNIGPDDFKPEDGGSLSGDSMAGLAAAGIINQSMAQSILANNPNLSADKKVMLSAVASGRANITDAEKFKEEAKAVLGTDGKPAGGVIAGMSVDKSTVEAWTSALPKDVNVVQNFKAGGQQYAPVAVEGQSYRVDHLSDETLLDMATQPGVNMDNPLRTAAETEYNRRQNQQQPPKNNP